MASPNLAESREKELRVVAIGGGTGLSTLLRGLKRYVVTPDRRRGIRIGGAPEMQSSPSPPCPSLRCIIRELSAVVTGVALHYRRALGGGDGDRRWRLVGASSRRLQDAATGRHTKLHGGAVRGRAPAVEAVSVSLRAWRSGGA